ncbi:MAG: Trk system potassium transporter TrkA [Acholeplasmatales bacterium]|nr:Trk system potassium transporter TrkA [Acholeplasmatales bacterium]
MKILVIGNGKVGKVIVENTCQEGHEVVVVDTDNKNVEELINKFDVMGVNGNGASLDILKEADAGKADLVVAATTNDETNILACLISKNMGAKATVARVRNYEYSNQLQIIKEDLGITMPINPEKETAEEIIKLLNFPEAVRVDSFANDSVDLVELHIPEGNVLVGQTLRSIYQSFKIKVLVTAVERGDDVFIPSGDFVLEAYDRIYITANSRTTLKKFIEKVSLSEKKIKNVMIIGGGKISAFLAAELTKSKINVKIIENSYDRCVELSTLIPNASVIHGDGSNQELLFDEGLDTMDAIACLTGNDEENIIISMFANKENIKKIITKVNKASLTSLVKSISNISVVSPKDLTASKIISYIRGIDNTRGSNVVTLHKLVNNKVEAVEFIAKENKRLLNIPLKDLKMKKNFLIAAIIRGNEVIIPSGNDYIDLNDRVIIVTTTQFLKDLDEILV